MERVVIVDYGSGNLHSAAKAFERAAREWERACTVLVSSKAGDVMAADRVVLPGVGAFGDCRAGLGAVDGLEDALVSRVRGDGVPFLGICVGMQLMADVGLEHGRHEGFGWIPGRVERILPSDPALKVPHMGWNTLNRHRAHPLLDDLETGENGWHAYFVHSYHFVPERPEDVIATTDYGGQVTAMVGRDNLVGTQFHPEKSQRLGLRLIGHFLGWQV